MKSLYESIIKNTRIGKYAKDLHGFRIDDIVYSNAKQVRFFIVTDIDEKKDTITIQKIKRIWHDYSEYLPAVQHFDGEPITIHFDKKSDYFWLDKYAILKKWDGKPIWSVI